MMRPAAVLCAFAMAAGSAGAAEPRDPLDRARLLYNQHQYEAAIAAADEARRAPDRADSADLVAARALLERFRASASADDLAAARERLRRIVPTKFNTRERMELVVGYGETLYFENAAGAAAEVFESVLLAQSELPADARELVLDWWASALDQEARPRPDIERQAVYQRIRDRMAEEIAATPSSVAASYWASAAARGQGDLQAAWDAAQAGWVRSPLALDRAASLRTDLDDLMLKAVVPERARVMGKPPDVLLLEWEQFKERWSR